MWERRKPLGSDFARRWNQRGADGAHRPRVLVEDAEVARVFTAACRLEDNGYAVSWCPGPTGPPGRRCPLVECGHCALVDRADVVVSSLDLRHDSARRVVAAFRHLHHDTPLVIRAPSETLDHWAPVFEGTWGGTRMSGAGDGLLETVGAALTAPAAASGRAPVVLVPGAGPRPGAG